MFIIIKFCIYLDIGVQLSSYLEESILLLKLIFRNTDLIKLGGICFTGRWEAI